MHDVSRDVRFSEWLGRDSHGAPSLRVDGSTTTNPPLHRTLGISETLSCCPLNSLIGSNDNVSEMLAVYTNAFIFRAVIPTSPLSVGVFLSLT